VADSDGRPAVVDFSVEVRRGEILAIAGVQGNGQTELAEALLGARKPASGTIDLDGHRLSGRHVRRVLAAGVGFVPEDRHRDGLVGEFSIAENLILDRLGDQRFVRYGSLRRGEIETFANETIAEFDVRAANHQARAGQLSGGNQQKVVLARELSRELHLLIASQPTRGVDGGSIEFINQRIIAARDDGVPVIVVSTELDEVVALADRILVMYRGRAVGIVPADTPRDVLGLMMAGVRPPAEERRLREPDAHA
jgi:general nucleoside transport system ATP-binding protein